MFFSSDKQIDEFTERFDGRVGEIWTDVSVGKASPPAFSIIALIDKMCPFGARLGRFEEKRSKKKGRSGQDLGDPENDNGLDSTIDQSSHLSNPQKYQNIDHIDEPLVESQSKD